MAYVEGSSGSMLQGVSQQPARLRTAGQVTEQINYDSVVSTGLTARPGTEEIAVLDTTGANLRMSEITHNGVGYIVGYRLNTELRLWTLDGTEYTVTSNAPTGYQYMGNNMVFLSDVQENYVICLSRDRRVRMLSTIEGRSVNALVVTCLGGLYLRTYKVTLTAPNGDTQELSFTTPDGTDPLHAEETTAESIVQELKDVWDAATLPSGFSGVTAEVADNHLLFHGATLTASVSDGEGGDTLRWAGDTVKDEADLPKTTQHGHTVKVLAGRSEDDDYYLRFVSDVTEVDGEGFGSGGVWREVADPDAANMFNLNTMPHKITIDPDTETAVLDVIEWEPRRAGDENTAPLPSFIEERIRDIVIFENRIMVIGGGSVHTTRTDRLRDFWRASATVVAADDPIDMRSTTGDNVTLDWIVPFDTDLLVVADPGSAQFIIRGGQLTPNNASMVLSTEYEVDSGVRPTNTGRTIPLPFRTGSFVGVNEFFTQEQSSTTAADPITAVQDRYITAPIAGMAVAENFSIFTIRSETDPRTIWVYRYLWDNTQRLQAAWYKLEWQEDIITHFYDNSYLYVVTEAENGYKYLSRADMNRVIDTNVGFHVTLDRKRETQVGILGQVFLPTENSVIVQSTGCPDPGLLAPVDNPVEQPDGRWRVYMDLDQFDIGSSVVVGIPVRRELTPTMPQPRTGDGQVASRASLAVRHFLVHMYDSPDIRTLKTSPYTTDREVYPRIVPTDSDPLDPDRLGKRDYVLEVPWRERHNRATLTLSSEDIRPDTILEIEFAGDLRGVRRRI